jgi:hypothetical protein
VSLLSKDDALAALVSPFPDRSRTHWASLIVAQSYTDPDKNASTLPNSARLNVLDDMRRWSAYYLAGWVIPFVRTPGRVITPVVALLI